MPIYLVAIPGQQPQPVEEDNPEQAVVRVREGLEEAGVFVPVPTRATVIGEDIGQVEVTV